jgi:hypothetical protein
MSAPIIESGNTFNKTATGDVVLQRDCVLLGFYVNSTSSGAVVLRKGGSSGTVMCGTITPAIGYHRFPANCPNGLHVTVGGTIDVTFFVIEGQA